MSEGWDAYLDPGERVVWEGKPSPKLFLLRGIDALLIPFALIWTLFVASAFLGTAGSAGAFGLVPLLFLVVGFYFLIGRFLQDQFVRQRTVYALTNKRAFIAKRAFGRSLREQPVNERLPISFKSGRLGRVTFGQPTSLLALSTGIGVWSGDDGSFTFRGIENAEEVYALVQRIKRGDLE